MSEENDCNICENCKTSYENLFSVHNMMLIIGMEFLCEGCFKRLMGTTFEEYEND